MTEILSLDIRDDAPFAGGAAFGETGAYRRIDGRARLAIRPEEIGADCNDQQLLAILGVICPL
ncbi:hypothetical protein RM543_10310 [Roseicyclus sp. F158]|uniref:Uncharacterized protein n=1 Tax=Tropicimonas omnivorans TaxID=3075590 RepID=A0ABU3DH99_9RHOB|nr:hypothetical protein [Roseicyclus sp. F158]MDT0683079.1 hypothetical protein [Roseicyclus sp. F158]